jgi:hypothetical protein
LFGQLYATLGSFDFAANIGAFGRPRIFHWQRFVTTLRFLRDHTAAGSSWNLFFNNLRVHEGIKSHLNAGRAPSSADLVAQFDLLAAGGQFSFKAAHWPQLVVYIFLPRPQPLAQLYELGAWCQHATGKNNLV